jgi:hypothetical protein
MFLRQLAAIAAAMLAAGCTLVEHVKMRDQTEYFDKARVENRPVVSPVRSVSNFNDALACMDRQLAAANLGTVFITSKQLTDPTGKLQVGLKDMVLTALLRMSRVSNTFRVVDYEVDAIKQDTVQTLTSLLLPTGQMEVRRPQIYISGGVAYSDTNVVSKRRNVGISGRSSSGTDGASTAQGSEGDAGYSWDTGASVLALDLHMGDFNSRTLLPGLESSNEIVIGQAGKALDLGGRIKKFGFQFEIASNASQGSGAAFRTLVDFSMIELIGKWARLPYWQCLQIDQVHPEMQRQMLEWYEDMSKADRIMLAKRALRQLGYFKGEINDQPTPELREALSRWQRDNNLPPMGLVSFETYEKLLSGFVEMLPDGTFRRVGWTVKKDEAPATLGDQPGSIAPKVALSVNRNEPIYSTGEVVVLRAVPNQSGHLMCFYQDSAGVVSQVFPNPQQPNSLVEANRAVMIPDINQPAQLFSIEASDPGTQAGACFLSASDVRGALPAEYRVLPLTPVAGVRSLKQVADAFNAVASQAGFISSAAVGWQVVPRPQPAQAAPQKK